MMKINFKHKGTEMILNYNSKGTLENVLNCDTNKNMMMEYTQVGTGYEMSTHNGYMKMDMCNATYIRIMDLDVFVPKFIFIPNING